MNIDLDRYLTDPTADELTARVVKSLLGNGRTIDYADFFGTPSDPMFAAGAEVEHANGWNWTAIFAKSLQWSLASLQVYLPPAIAEYGNMPPRPVASKALNSSGPKGHNIPEGWVLAPESHLVSRLFNNPNPWDSREQILFEMSMQIELHGVGYMLVLPDGNDMPKQIHILPRGLVWETTSREFPEGAYQTGQLTRLHCDYDPERDGPAKSRQQMLSLLSNKVFSAQYLVPLYLPSVLYKDCWTSPTRMMVDTLNTGRHIEEARFHTLRNQEYGGQVLREKPGVTLTPEQREAALAEFESNSTGSRNAGKSRFADPRYNVENNGYNAREMEFTDSAKQIRQDTLGQRMTPEAMVGLSEGSYANLVGLLRSASRFAFQPIMNLVAGQMESHLRSFFETPFNLFAVRLVAGSIDDPQMDQQQLQNAVTARAITVGEYRTAIGREPFGDERDDEFAGAPPVAAAPESPFGPYPMVNTPGLPLRDSNGIDRPNIGAPVSRAGADDTADAQDEPTTATKAIVGTVGQGATASMSTFRRPITPSLPYILLDPSAGLKACVANVRRSISTHSQILFDTPHITLHGPFAAASEKALRVAMRWLQRQRYVTGHLGEPEVFSKPGYDVLVVAVEAPRLHEMNDRLRTLLPPLLQTHDYRPHLTIGYLPSGHGHEYLALAKSMAGRVFQCERAVVKHLGTRTVVKLTDPTPPEPDPDDSLPLERPAAGTTRKDMRSYTAPIQQTTRTPSNRKLPRAINVRLPKRKRFPDDDDGGDQHPAIPSSSPDGAHTDPDDTDPETCDDLDVGWSERIEDTLAMWSDEEFGG